MLHGTQDFNGQPFHLLGLVQERVELDQFCSRLRDLTQPGDAG
jgi:hypothetical protein